MQRSAEPCRAVRMAPVEIALQQRPDGVIVVSNKLPLGALPVRQVGDYLRGHAQNKPDQTFLAEPDPHGGWARITYAQARQRVDALSQWLLDQDLPDDRSEEHTSELQSLMRNSYAVCCLK